MRPDERDLLPLPIDVDPALDAELAAIDDELAAAGRVVAAADVAPDPSFADALRARLLAELAAPTAEAETSHEHSAAASPSDAAVVAAAAANEPAPETMGAPLLPPAPISLVERRRSRSRLDARRWGILAVAAAVIVAVVGVGVSSRGLPAPTAGTLAATGTTLTRAGSTTLLSPGTSLAAGDTVTTGDAGAATIAIGNGFVRLDADSSIRIDALATAEVDLSQLAGRAWHRVDVPQGSRYVVATGDLRWTALGTAFDLRRGLPDAPSAIQLVAVVHDVALSGAGQSATVRQGDVATIDPSAAGSPAVTPAGETQTTDAWLIDNAAADRADGLDTGWLAGAPNASPSASSGPSPVAIVPSPSAEPTTSASAPSVEPSAAASASTAPSAPASASAPSEPTATPRPTDRPAPTPSAKPEPTPTPVPTPKPTPMPPPVEPLSLTVTSCDGGVLLNWSQYGGTGFHQYAALHSGSSFDMPATYPPSGDITAVASSVTTSIGLTSTVDRSLAVGATGVYRAGAWNSKGQLIGSSNAVAATRKAVATIGGMTVIPGGASTHVSWTPYGGACFTSYRVSWSASSADVSYLGAHDGSADNSVQAGADVNAPIPAGQWYVRVEVIKTTDLESFVVAQSEVQQITVTP